MKEYHGCAEVRRPSKKYLVFFNGEVFFLLTSPLMGAPTVTDQYPCFIRIETGSCPAIAGGRRRIKPASTISDPSHWARRN
jgi:hypothetical protein